MVEERLCFICRNPRGHRRKYCESCAEIAEEEFNREMQARYREKNREKLRQKQREWASNNPESVKEMSQKYAQAHMDEIVERNRKYRADNPGWWSFQKFKRRKERMRRNNRDKHVEVIVATLCGYCDEFVLTHTRRRQFCPACVTMYKSAVPRHIREKVRLWPSTEPMPDDLKRWRNVMKIRGVK